MRRLPYIILLALMALLGSSCKDVSALSECEAQPLECVQAELPSALMRESGMMLNREGTLSSPVSLCRTAFQSALLPRTRHSSMC